MNEYISKMWHWWQGSGSPGAAIQQIFFIVLTVIATIVAVVNLSTWTRQQRAGLRPAAIGEIIQSAVLVCDIVIVKTIRPEAIVWSNKLDKPELEWFKQARQRIEKERDCWTQRCLDLDARIRALKLAIAKGQLILGSDFDSSISNLMNFSPHWSPPLWWRATFRPRLPCRKRTRSLIVD